uniref:Mitochondrial import inner membrane translocase subunit TIM50 n=1 Tax=Lates calcarifer TaxID=8187 RepID=A0A4W6D8Q3_LATCA
MKLRSQRTVTTCPETPRSNGRRSVKATPRRRRPSVTESPLPTKVEETVDNDSHHSDDEVPTMTRRPLPRGRARKRAIAVEDRETDLAFKTPIRPIMRHERILSEINPSPPCNSTSRKIYSPIVRFLTPSKENMRCAGTGGNVLMSPEQGVFGYGSIDLLAGDEDDDVFNPFTFIKNIPSQSQHSQPRLRDIPPKTRSTPEATLVVDLEETLMFSSLNVIEDAEFTFHAAFQDHQYKVYMILRPHVREFLQSMAKIYELFVYTCAKKEYAEKILDILDPAEETVSTSSVSGRLCLRPRPLHQRSRHPGEGSQQDGGPGQRTTHIPIPSDEHASHQELVWGVRGQRTPETHPLHGETVHSGTSVLFSALLFISCLFHIFVY